VQERRGASALIEAAVLDAARRVFAERGFDGASVDAVAAAAGLTKGAVYSRFPTKEALFVAAALGHDDEVLADVVGETPSEWSRSWADGVEAQRPWAMLGMEFRLYALRNSSLAPVARDWQRRSHQRLRAEIERRTGAAGLRLRVEPDDAAAILAAVAAGLAQQRYTDDDVEAGRLMEAVVDLLIER
jgi:AcrR family transcriptional regulator